MLFHSLLQAVAAVTFLAATAKAQNCQHGLTANDIAADTGLNLTGKVALVTGGRSGLVSDCLTMEYIIPKYFSSFPVSLIDLAPIDRDTP